MGEGESIPLQFGKVHPGLRDRARAGRDRHAACARASPRSPIASTSRCASSSAVFLVLVIVAAVIKERANARRRTFAAGRPRRARVQPREHGRSATSCRALLRVERAPGDRDRHGDRDPQRHARDRDRARPALLNNPTMAIPPAIYSLIMFFTAAAFGLFVARRTWNVDEGTTDGSGAASASV